MTAVFDDSREGMLRLRYEAAWTRLLHKSISDLDKLQKNAQMIDYCECDEGETSPETAAPAAETAPEDSSEADTVEYITSEEPPRGAVLRNEPKAAPEVKPESGPEGPETGREGPEMAPSGGADGFRPVV